MSKTSRTIFSDSPRHFEDSVDAETLKNVVWHSLATAFASIVFPVPGGPNMSTPFQGRRSPWKKSGIQSGSTCVKCSVKTRRGDAGISRGDESRRRRGRDLDFPQRRESRRRRGRDADIP